MRYDFLGGARRQDYYGSASAACMATAPVTTDVNVHGEVSVLRGNMYADPGRYKVNIPKTLEVIKQPLYSYQLYPAAGQAQLGFFQTQVGGAVTTDLTNMQLQGQLPSPQMFLIEAIGIDYLPGTTAAPPVLTRADAATGALNDFYTIMRQGTLTLTIGSKQYFQMAPLMSLPPRAHMDAATAVTSATTAAAALQTIVQIPFSTGPVFKMVPLLLESSQNFSVVISFPGGAVAVPSGDALAKMGVVMYGTLYRPAQ